MGNKIKKATQVAQAQAGLNKDTAITQAEMNMVNQVTPGGTTTYSQTGTSAAGNPQYTVTQTLSPTQQALQDKKDALSGSTLANANTTLGQPANLGTAPTLQTPTLQTGAGQTTLGTGYQAPTLSTDFAGANVNQIFGGVGLDQNYAGGTLDQGYAGADLGTGYAGANINQDFQGATLDQGFQGGELGTDFATAELDPNFQNANLNTNFTQQGQDIIYDLGKQRLDPRFEQERQTLEASLAERGIRPGMEAYNRAITQFEQYKNDAYNSLMLQGLETAAGIAGNEFQAGLSQEQFNSGQLNSANQAKLLQAGITNQQLQLINQGKMDQAGLTNEQLQLVNQARQEQQVATNSQIGQSNQAALQQQQATNTQIDATNAAKLQQAGITNQQLQLINQGRIDQAGLTNEQLQLVNQARLDQQGANNQAQAQGNTAALQQQQATNTQVSLSNDAAAQQAEAFNAQLSQMNAAQIQQAGLDIQRQMADNQTKLQQAQAANDAAQTQFLTQQQTELLRRQQAIQEAQAATTMGQVAPIATVNTPQTGVATADLTGTWNNLKAQNTAQQNALLGGIGSLAGTAGSVASSYMLSDRRAKTDAKRVGKLDDGTPVHAYRYKGSPMMQLGVMAQEAQKKHPKAVARTRRGMMAVDYGKLASEVA